MAPAPPQTRLKEVRLTQATCIVLVEPNHPRLRQDLLLRIPSDLGPRRTLMANPQGLVSLEDTLFPLNAIVLVCYSSCIVFLFKNRNRSNGLFLIEFGCDGDRRRVLLQQPWTYLNQAILMDIPTSVEVLNGDSLLKISLWVQVFNTPFLKRTEQLAELVSASLGDLLEIYRPSLRETWGPYFRIRVMFDVANPLPRGVPIHFTGINKVVWLELKYENLPDICFFCGRMGHSYNKGCVDYMKACDEAPFPPELRYDIRTIVGLPAAMKIVSWNARGIGSERAFRNLSRLVTVCKPDILFIMESRLAKHDVETLRLKLHFDSGLEVPRIGRSGGLILLWTNDVIVNLLSQSISHFDCYVSCSSQSKFFHFTCFYGSPIESNRRQTWKILDRIGRSNPIDPWLIIGDFNAFLFSNDKQGGNPDRGPSTDFRQFLDLFNLTPLDPKGAPLTWNNNVAAPRNIQERIDWGIVNNAWINNFPNVLLSHLGFFSSDHRALELATSNPHITSPSANNKRFLFENVWLSDPNWTQVFQKSWANLGNLQAAIPNLIAIQKECANTLNAWNHKKDFQFKKHILRLEKDLEKARESPVWDAQTIAKIKDVQSSYHSRNGVAFPIAFHFLGPFRNGHARALEGIDRSLSIDDIHLLEVPFTHTEIEKAFHQLPLDKAPGIDGFNSQFYKDNWTFLRNDVINAALSFLNGDGDIAPLNTTLITLIPKVKNPTVLTEYRPISLCSIVYKIISKSIANKLKLVLNNLISPNQSAFFPGHLISDNIIIAQEVAHSIKLRTRGRKGWMAVKLDMAKAFDRVEWAFIAAILSKFLFPQRFINLILACLSTATFQFNFNGKVVGNVIPTRGIRQGDPLSPYLFLLCAEGLSSLIQQKERNHSLMVYKVARRAPAISHLLFADDSFLFCNASIQSCNIIKEILKMYERASRQKVNFQKSSLYFSPNVELRDQTLISDFLQIPIRSSFEKYLGLPQHIGRTKKQVFHYLHDKVWAHLHNWKNKVFSKGGKEILLKSVIQAIPTYTMACFCIPSATCHSLESIMANFWWGFNDNNRPKIHWQSWKKLRKSKKDGGLGFRSLVHFNQALLAKQAWRIFKQPNSLVSKILEARYYPNSSFLNSALGLSPSFVWRSICWGRELLQKGLISKISNGQSTSTTGNHWIPGFRQHTTFDTAPPTVAAFITLTMTWNIALLERYYPPHVIDAILSIPLPLQPSNDELIWELSNSGIYSVKIGYHLSFSSFTPPDIPSSSSLSPWNKARKDQVQDKTHAILTLARNFLDDYNLPSSRQSPRAPPSRLSHPTSWTPPAQGCLKLNVDASTTKDRLKAGFNGVIRNSEGLVVAALASPYLGGGTVASLEAKSLLRMLQWCIEEHFHVHEIETDCKTITDALSSSRENISVFGDTLKQIKDALSLLPATQVSHVPRSANTFADKLAH
uniref:Reverse transcriptase domain-containing protein n=1 Tax=Cannabis sativa TaxID=3483 RepID=A0A803PAC6_CANSA